jgi:hypothetical protein
MATKEELVAENKKLSKKVTVLENKSNTLKAENKELKRENQLLAEEVEAMSYKPPKRSVGKTAPKVVPLHKRNEFEQREAITKLTNRKQR